MPDPSKRPGRSDFLFFWPVVVRWSDMDALGHVNNATYFTYMEAARVGFFEKLGWSVVEHAGPPPFGPVVVSQTFNYRRAVVYPSRLEVGVRCAEFRDRSFVLVYGIFEEGTDVLVGDGTTVLVWTDLAAGKAVALPADIRRGLERTRLAVQQKSPQPPVSKGGRGGISGAL
ncbi:MAG TPA: thioesterase family protein [Candidatus Sulfotelmatobacter sp.]|nr:thioesterase family protein [Candidatus Sulfotelmatobacter sp.]